MKIMKNILKKSIPQSPSNTNARVENAPITGMQSLWYYCMVSREYRFFDSIEMMLPVAEKDHIPELKKSPRV